MNRLAMSPASRLRLYYGRSSSASRAAHAPVPLRAEPSEALLVQKDLQGIHACDEDVQAEVELVALQEEWTFDVGLDDDALCVGDSCDVVEDEDPSSSR
eukprot:440798-Hanusia_phi.AAC.11